MMSFLFKKASSLSFLLIIVVSCVMKNGLVKGFVRPGMIPGSQRHGSSTSTTTINMHMDAAAIQEIESARTAFVLCFFGAVGSAAVGREAIPVTLREWKKTNELQGKGGTTLGGEEIDLFGYPEPVYTNDVMSILNNNMTVYEMMETYPVDNAMPGYLRFESLAQANYEKCPQIAVRAVFDAVAVGINKNQVSPVVAATKMESFKQDLEQMKQSSRLTKTIGVSALIILLSILGVADFFTIYHLWHGWFPEWQGFSNMPVSLFDERGIGNLAACFVGDLPTPVAEATNAFPM